MVKNLFNKTKLLAAAVVMSVAMVATAVTVMTSNNSAQAASSCTQHDDAVNIIYGGIDCHSLSADVAAFKAAYTSNSSGHSASPSVKKNYNDLQTVYNWTGASKSLVDGMTTSNSALGTMYKDGHVEVNGKTVATDAWVTARFNGSGFVHVTGNVYARKTTTSLAESSAPVLVAYDSNGQAAFVVMIDCGNGVKVTPTPKPKPPVPPQPSMSCDQLAFTKKTDTDYTLTAQASVKNATITGYTFTFGDGQTKTVTTGNTSTAVDHTYKPGSYTASVAVTVTANGKSQTISSAACAGKVTVPQPAAVVACTTLTFSDNELAFTFSAAGTAQNATINSFTFDFGDSSAKKTIAATANKATATYNYPAAGTHTASVTVNYTDLNGKQAATSSAACAVKVTPSQPMCTNPTTGKQYPVGSPECQPPAPVMSCDELVISNKGTDTTSLQYNFTVKASATNATIGNYTIDFGDGTPVYNGAAPSVDHAYAKVGPYTITASVNVTANGKSQVVTSAACAGSITITPPMCTIPGKEQYPAGDTVNCSTPPPVTPPTTPPVTPPTTPPAQLVNTGPGATIGLFTGFVIAGAAAHRIMASRRLFGLGR